MFEKRAQIGHGVIDAIERNIAVQGRGAGLHLRAARQLARHNGPLGEARRAAFVANPAHVRPAIVEDHGIGLVFAHELDISRENRIPAFSPFGPSPHAPSNHTMNTSPYSVSNSVSCAL